MSEITENKDRETPAPVRYTLPKSTKLRHRTLVEGLFEHGRKLYDFPLRAIWRTLDDGELTESFRIAVPGGIGRVQMMITVPKRKRRRAVDRVLLRRRIREAFRLNRHILEHALTDHPEIRTLEVAFIYLHDENVASAQIHRKMQRLLTKIASQL